MDTVFVSIFHEYRDILTPVILEMITTTNMIVSPDDMQQILKKDAIYNAAALCAFDLYDEVNMSKIVNLFGFLYLPLEFRQMKYCKLKSKKYRNNLKTILFII